MKRLLHIALRPLVHLQAIDGKGYACTACGASSPDFSYEPIRITCPQCEELMTVCMVAHQMTNSVFKGKTNE